MPACFSCGVQINDPGKPGRADTCLACDADLHCCRNCAFYDPGSYNECREPQAERVLEKDRSNFCDYFAFGQEARTPGNAGQQGGSRGNPLDGLFKK